MSRKSVSRYRGEERPPQGCILTVFGFALLIMGLLMCWAVIASDGFSVLAILPIAFVVAVLAFLFLLARSKLDEPRGFLRVQTGVKSKGKTAVTYSSAVLDRAHPADLEDEKVMGPQKFSDSLHRVHKFVIVTVFMLGWNALVGFFVMGWLAQKSSVWGVLVFFMALLGVLLIVATIYTFLAMFNPKVELALSEGAVARGKSAELKWRLIGNSSNVASIKLLLECEEKIVIPKENDSVIRTEKTELISLVDVSKPGAIPNGKVSFTIPSDSMHTFASCLHGVTWWIALEAEIPRRPNSSERFELRVKP